MSEKSKRGKRRGASGENGARNALGQFLKGGPGGPGRGHGRDRGDLAGRPTPAGRPGGEPIAREELEDRLELAERGLELARSGLALAEGRLARAGREWGAALRALEKFPDARRAVLAALWPAEEAERAGRPGQAAADAGTARPGGDGVAGQPADVPLPEGKRGPGPTVSDGVARRPVPPGWGGIVERGSGGRDELLDDTGPGHGIVKRWGDEM